jgi:serine/threonine-protein kinase
LLPAPKPPEIPRRKRWVGAALAFAVLVGAAVLGQRLGVLTPGIVYTSKTSLAAADSLIPEGAKPYELYLEARKYLDRFDRKDNPENAIRLLKAALEKDNTYAPGYAALTEAYRYRDKVSPDKQWLRLMEESAKRALDLNGDLAAAHIAMGLALMETSGRWKESESHLNRAIELDPKSSAAHKWLGVLLTSMGRAEAAEKAFDRALQLDPKNWAALLDLGVLRYRTEDFAKAAEKWEEARALCPDNVRILANLSAAYHKLDLYEDAASVLQRAIEIQPSAQHYANLGTLRFFQGRYAEAISAFQQAVDREPARPEYWGNLADAYRWSPGDRGRAREPYIRAIQLLHERLELKPQDPDMLSTLALYLAKSEDKKGSVRELSKLESLKPDQADVLFRMAVAYEICELRERALETLEKSLAAGFTPKEIRNEPELLKLRSEDSRYHRIMAAPAVKRPA